MENTLKMSPIPTAMIADPEFNALAASVPGRKHLREGIPCQDASFATADGRPLLVVADGRGSAMFSHFGAQSACQAAADTALAAEKLIAAVLDCDDFNLAQTLWPHLHDLLFRAVLVRQRVAASDRALPTDQLEHTLMLVILGRRRLLCLHVGDGAVVIEDADGLRTLSGPERGEFANVTCFVGEKTRANQIRGQLAELHGFVGVAAMSDGAAERLLHGKTLTPAPGLATIFRQSRDGRFSRRELLGFLTEPFWEPAVQDDRSLAVLATGKPSGMGDDGVASPVPTAASEPLPPVTSAPSPSPTDAAGTVPDAVTLPMAAPTPQAVPKRWRPVRSRRVAAAVIAMLALTSTLAIAAFLVAGNRLSRTPSQSSAVREMTSVPPLGLNEPPSPPSTAPPSGFFPDWRLESAFPILNQGEWLEYEPDLQDANPPVRE